MRILRLDLDDGEGLDLHPYVTMLGGFAPGDRRRVVDRLLRLTRGDASGGPGLVEVDGVLSEVDQAVLAALALDPSLEPVVRVAQLPGATVDPSGTDLDDRTAAARGELARVESELAAARDAVARATQALDDARRGLDDYAITAHDAALSAVAAAEDAARARLSASPVVDRRAALIEELDAARRDSEAHDLELQTERVALLELLEALEAEQLRVDELTARRDAGHNGPREAEPAVPSEADVATVTRALEVVRAGPPPPARIPAPEAVDLADRIADHERRHDELEEALRDEGIDVRSLQDQLTVAQLEAREAAEAARPKLVSPEDDAEIERLHDLVVDHGEKRKSRRSGKGTERAYEEAGEALEALLESVGYPTYAAYVMGRISPSVDPDAKRRHDEALARVAEVETELDAAADVLERDSRVLMLRAERDQLWAEARDTLGTLPDDVEGALRAMRIDAPVEFTAVDDLRAVLDGVGTTCPTDDETTVVAIAETYLADAAIARAAAEAPPADDIDPLERDIRDATRRVAELHEKATEGDATLAEWEAESERLAAEVAAAQARLDAHDSSSVTAEDAEHAAVSADPAVSEARGQAALTSARLARHRAAVEQVDDRHADLRSARSVEREVEARHDAMAAGFESTGDDARPQDDGPDPEVVWELDGDDVGPVESYLLGRVASLREVGDAGPVPLILDDAFRGLPDPATRSLCKALARIGQSVQVIYVGDAPAVAAWAAKQGLDHAAVVRPGQPAL